MRQSKFTETQIVSILKEADAGRPVNETTVLGFPLVVGGGTDPIRQELPTDLITFREVESIIRTSRGAT